LKYKGSKETPGFKKIGRKTYKCEECIKKAHAERREFIKREVFGVRKKEDIMREAAERRRKREVLLSIVTPKPVGPVIPGGKEKKTFRIGSNKLHVYLTMGERQMLFTKYLRLGVPVEVIREKVDELRKVLNLISQRIRDDNKDITDVELDRKIREEFEKVRVKAEEELKEQAI